MLGAAFMWSLCRVDANRMGALCSPGYVTGTELGVNPVYDFLVVVLGVGTILLMGAYAELCDRI
jgi:hypothetical protein